MIELIDKIVLEISSFLYDPWVPLFLVVAALHVIGNLAECIFRDKEDGGHRLFIASKISLVMGALVCFYMTMRLNEDIPLTTDGLNAFEKNMISYKRALAMDPLSSSFDASVIAPRKIPAIKA